jgi:hypothetical protein
MTNTSIARLFEMTSQGVGKWKKEIQLNNTGGEK